MEHRCLSRHWRDFLEKTRVKMSFLGADGIIFDFNGTLYWDETENRKAWNRTAVMIRGKELTDEEFSFLNGRTDEETVLYFLPDADVPTIDYWSDEKEKIYKEICIKAGPRLSPGALEILSYLKSRNMPMAIASSAPKVNMDWYIPYFNLTEFFPLERIIAGRRDIPSKPDGTIFRLAAESIGLPSSRTLIFEDSESGVKAALDAGCMKVIRIRGPKGMDLSIGGIEEIASFSELLDAGIQGW